MGKFHRESNEPEALSMWIAVQIIKHLSSKRHGLGRIAWDGSVDVKHPSFHFGRP